MRHFVRTNLALGEQKEVNMEIEFGDFKAECFETWQENGAYYEVCLVIDKGSDRVRLDSCDIDKLKELLEEIK